jgi:hypothetical protein
MGTSTGARKILTFALFGAAGCLLAALAGEGLLAFTPQTGESLMAEPTTPPLPPTVEAPPDPARPEKIPVPTSRLPPSPEIEKRMTEAKARKGDVVIGLIWNNRNDLDLHCIPPIGEKGHVSFRNKKPATGGELDVDANNGELRNPYGDTRTPREHIVWDYGKAPLGEYKVFVEHFARKFGSEEPTAFEVEIQVDDVVVGQYKRSIARGTSDVKPRVAIPPFKVSPVLRLGVPKEVAVNPGGKNRLGVLLERKRLLGDTTITFTGAVSGLTLAPVVIPDKIWTKDAKSTESTRVEVEVSAAEDADPGERTIAVTAKNGAVEAKSSMKVMVQRLPSILQVSLPPAVEVNQGGKNRFTVQIGRTRFKGPVRLVFTGDDTGLTLAEQMISADADKIEVPVSAESRAEPGERRITVQASAPGVTADGSFTVKLNKVARAADNAWSWTEVLRIGGWTALLAVGLALALVCGQNFYLNKPLVNRGLIFTLAGSLVAGALAGGLAQALFASLAAAEMEPLIGFVVGWLLLGALLGRGVGFFIPNLSGWRASVSGAAGGLLAGVLFLIVSRSSGAIASRLLGAGLLGLAIGLMVAWAEQIFRKYWLEVRYGTRERVTVNLGPEPIKVGSDSRACAVYARGAAPVALRYWLREGRIYCEDLATGQNGEAVPDEPRQLGTITLTVRSATVSAVERKAPAPASSLKPTSPAPAPAPAPLPLPPVPVEAKTATAPARPITANSCPKCGRVVDGPVGRRYCIVDDLTF